MTYWLSSAGGKSLTVHSGQRSSLLCAEAGSKCTHNHIKYSSKQQEMGSRAVLYGLSLFLPMGVPPKESEGFSHPVRVGKDALEEHFLGAAMCFPG